MKPNTEAKIATIVPPIFFGSSLVMALGGLWKPLFFIGLSIAVAVVLFVAGVIYFQIKKR
jgi:hypothetical protein